MTGIVGSGAFAAGQILGTVLLLLIVGLAIRDQVRKHRD